MKVQMQGQQLRLRISEAELVRLQAGEVIVNLTRMPGGITCRQHLLLGDAAQPALIAEPGGWRFLLPRMRLADYVVRLPCREGLALRLALEDGEVLDIEFEVDVRDSVRSRGVQRR